MVKGLTWTCEGHLKGKSKIVLRYKILFDLANVKNKFGYGCILFSFSQGNDALGLMLCLMILILLLKSIRIMI